MRRRQDKGALNDLNRILQVGQDSEAQLSAVINWISNPNRSEDEVDLFANVLENGFCIKYFQSLRNRLSPANYSYFLTHLSVEHRTRGSIVIDKGKKNDSFFVILQGEVLILDEISQEIANYLLRSERNLPDNREPVFETINALKAGDTFGELSLINPKILTTARVVAKTDCIFLVANEDTFSRTLNQEEHMKQSEKLNYFRNNILFEGIDEDRIRDLLNQIREIRYGLNERIFETGNCQEEMYFIVDGEVEIVNSKGHGFIRLGAREHFGVEKDICYNGPRQECAISKSQQLILYRVFFKRLAVLQEQLPKFMNSLSLNLTKKKKFYRQLEENQRVISHILQHPHQKNYRKKKRRNFGNVLKPNFEWWGITNNTSNPKLECVKRTRYENLRRREQVKKEPLETNNSGVTRIAHFLQTCKEKLLTPSDCWLEEQENEASYVSRNNLTCILGKKTIKFNEQTNEADCPSLPKHALPKISKQKLLRYARSTDNFCQKLYLD